MLTQHMPGLGCTDLAQCLHQCRSTECCQSTAGKTNKESKLQGAHPLATSTASAAEKSLCISCQPAFSSNSPLEQQCRIEGDQGHIITLSGRGVYEEAGCGCCAPPCMPEAAGYTMGGRYPLVDSAGGIAVAPAQAGGVAGVVLPLLQRMVGLRRRLRHRPRADRSISCRQQARVRLCKMVLCLPYVGATLEPTSTGPRGQQPMTADALETRKTQLCSVTP